MTLGDMRVGEALLGVLLLVAPLGACDKLRESSEQQQQETAEQAAIRRYSEATEPVNAQLRRFVDTWDHAMKNEEVDTLTAAIRDSVIPSLESYVAALQAMPVETERLQGIHGVVVGAYRDTLSELRTFTAELTENNRRQPVEGLIAALGRLAEREREYREKLEGYYREHNVKLVATEPVAGDAGARLAPPAGAGPGAVPAPDSGPSSGSGSETSPAPAP